MHVVCMYHYRSGLVTLSVFTKANEVDEGQIDFIQTLKRSTISVATAKCDFVPTGGIGCIPLNVSMLCMHVCMCVCMYMYAHTYVRTYVCMYVCMQTPLHVTCTLSSSSWI